MTFLISGGKLLFWCKMLLSVKSPSQQVCKNNLIFFQKGKLDNPVQIIYRDQKLLQYKGVQITVTYTQGYFLYDTLA